MPGLPALLTAGKPAGFRRGIGRWNLVVVEVRLVLVNKLYKSSRKFSKLLFALLIILLPTQLGRHFWPDWTKVLGLKVDYLSPTLYLTDLLVLGIFVNWIIVKIKSQKSKVKNTIQKSKITFVFLVTCLLLLITNVSLASNQLAAIYKLIKLIEFGFLALYVSKNLKSYILNLISRLLPVSVVFTCLLAIVQFIKQSSIGGLFWYFGERTFTAATSGISQAIVNGNLIMRPYATFSHPNQMAGFLLVSLILTLPGVYRKSKLLAIGYLLLVILVIGLSFSRTIWVVGVVIGGIGIMRGIGKNIKGVWVKILGVGILVGLGSTIFLFSRGFSTAESWEQRTRLVGSAFRMFIDNPIFGVGLNNFIIRQPEYWLGFGSIYLLQPVHNIYLLTLAEMGIMGAGVVIWGIWKILMTPSRWPACRQAGLWTPGKWGVFLALLAILLSGLSDHYWITLQQTQLLFAIVLGMVFSDIKQKKFRQS